MQSLLVIEDDPNITDIITKYAECENFSVASASDGRVGLEMALSGGHDLVVLDINLPSMNGTEVCRNIRARSAVPIIFLTAREEEIDRVLGLELGADDYMTKPFSPRELMARIKAVLRRTAGGHAFAGHTHESRPDEAARKKAETGNTDDAAHSSGVADNNGLHGCAADRNPNAGISPGHSSGGTVVRGKLAIDTIRRIASVNGTAISITYTQYELLLKLAQYPGRVFSREELYESVWGERADGISRTVDVHIKHLREAISSAMPGFAPISSIRSVGYRFDEAGRAGE